MTHPNDNYDGHWTSFHDIGKLVSKEEYLKVEKAYIDTIISICTCLGIKKLIVSDLEIYGEGSTYVNNEEIGIKDVRIIAKAILRESIWCKLKSPNIEFHFGYDYYMYFLSKSNPGRCLDQVAECLYCVPFLSPYLENEEE